MQKKEIRNIANSRLKDAQVLLKNRRYSGAIYVCGYAIELGLKNQICKTLKWSEYPPGGKFKNYQSFKTHDLETLLSLSGKEQKIKSSLFAEWSIVSQWKPESRYQPIKRVSKHEAVTMIQSTITLLKSL